MEQINETFHAGLVHRAVAFGMAVVTTALIATSTAVVFTATQDPGSVLIHAAVEPVRAALGV